MSKEVELEIKIDKFGKIYVLSKGTIGNECLDLMKFLDKIDGFKNISTKTNEDFHTTNLNDKIQINKSN